MIEISFSYKPLFKLSILHNYYVGNLAKDIVLKSTENSLKLAKRLGLVLKESDGEYVLMVEPSKLEALHFEIKRNAFTKFTYLIYSDNPYFLNFTETPSEINNLMFYFSNNTTRKIEGSDFLHDSEFVNANNKFPVKQQVVFEAIEIDRTVEFRDDNDSVVFSRQLPKNERLIVDNSNLPIGLYQLFENGKSIEKFILFSNLPVRKPIGVIDISFSGAIKNDLIDRIEGFDFPFFNYQVHFNARNTFWRYLLISKYNSNLKNTMIDSGTDNLKFSGPKEVKLKNGTDAITFVSEVPLSLKQAYEWKFQLKMLGSGFTGAKTIMDRLPLASPEIIKSESGSDELKFFSEIIVYI